MSHLLRASGMRFSTPGMWWALISNSCRAASSSNSRKQLASIGLRHRPVLSTITETSLSHRSTILFLFEPFPHTLAATTMVNNSSAFMLSFCWSIFSGKVLWKNCLFSLFHAPQPCKQASDANISSGDDHWLTAIMEMPLYWGRNNRHHLRSAQNPSGIGCLPVSGRPLMNSSIRVMNSLPGLTQLAKNCNLPTMCCTSFRDTLSASNHSSRAAIVSCTLSCGTERVKLTE